MSTQDDLASLFQRQLSIQRNIIHNPQENEAKEEQQPFYSISQHYHHSTHIAQETSTSIHRPSTLDQLAAQIILRGHRVDMNSFSQSQIELFLAADAGQRKRLIELWQIWSPDYHEYNIARDPRSGSLSPLNEIQSKIQYEDQIPESPMMEADGDFCMQDDSMSGSCGILPLVSIQNRDGQWHQADQNGQNRYEALAQHECERISTPGTCFGDFVGNISRYRHATDPVYNSVS